MTRTSATTMMVGMIGAILLAATGCTATSTHTLDSGHALDIYPGECQLVAGPYHIPAGAITSYSIFDGGSYPDDMDIGVVDDIYGCSPSSGFAYTSGYGTVSDHETVTISSTYNLAIRCNNLVYDCLPTVDDWSYE